MSLWWGDTSYVGTLLLWCKGVPWSEGLLYYQCSFLQEYSLWNGEFISLKSTTHDIIEFNPVFLVIVASHIRPQAMIIASFTSMLRISVKDCEHRSQPDVWGNNDCKHRIKPLNQHSQCFRSFTKKKVYFGQTYDNHWYLEQLREDKN